ncbi:MAG: RrF2 family transcriptional regulator [bacterium]|nr:RrF2 family transcriptional regulator [Candidatus Margulisiibacteriota bacterium]
MKLSTRGRYAVSAMFDLAAHGEGKPVSAAVISKRQKISVTYLEQLLSKLRHAKLIKTVRGPSGGYVLAKKPGQVTIGDIIKVTDGPIALADCVSEGDCCPKSGCCSTKNLWHNLSEKISKLLDKTTLKDLCKEVHG